MLINAPAKLNLALHVTGLRHDGYHRLDSVIAFTELGDSLDIAQNAFQRLSIDGPFADELDASPSNLIWRAALALAENQDISDRGFAINLIKNLPVASGVGGGSADAAATLKGLTEIWKLDCGPADLANLGVALGADVPMCLFGNPAHAEGIGDILSPITLPRFDIVIANINTPVSTPEVFKRLVKKDNPPLDGLPPFPADKQTWLSYLARQRNDLQDPAIQIVPEISDCLTALEKAKGCQFARMSGSGATCFGLFQDADSASAAREELSDKYPQWWVACTTTRS